LGVWIGTSVEQLAFGGGVVAVAVKEVVVGPVSSSNTCTLDLG
jgi:hypothetical protein